jgi:hypothetical protein
MVGGVLHFTPRLAIYERWSGQRLSAVRLMHLGGSVVYGRPPLLVAEMEVVFDLSLCFTHTRCQHVAIADPA